MKTFFKNISLTIKQLVPTTIMFISVGIVCLTTSFFTVDAATYGTIPKLDETENSQETQMLNDLGTNGIKLNNSQSSIDNTNSPSVMQMLQLQLQQKDDLKKIEAYHAKQRAERHLSRRAVGDADVSTWDEFVSAASDPNIDTINLKADLKASSNATISSDKIINFNGFKIVVNDIYNTYRSITIASGNVKLVSPTIENDDRRTTGINITSAFTFQGGSLTVTGNAIITGRFFAANDAPGDLTFQDANVVFNNNITDGGYLPGPGYSIISMTGKIAGSVKILNSTINESSYGFIYFANPPHKSLLIDDNSKVTSTQPDASRTGYIYYFVVTPQDQNVVDAGIELTIKGHSSVNINKASTYDICGPIKVYGRTTKISLSEGATLDVTNPVGAGIAEAGDGSSFTLDGEGTELKVTRGNVGVANPNNAPIRFALSGGMVFDITDKAKVDVYQNNPRTNTYGIRMFGDDNKINVSGGAEFNVYNNNVPGVAAPGNTGEPGGQGIEYAGGTAGKSSNFNLTGKDLQVLIDSKNGPAIQSIVTGLGIKAGDGTSFVARGRMDRNSIFIAPGAQVLDFDMKVPRYFDFMNYAPNKIASANLFGGGTTSKFTHGPVPLSVWDNNSDVLALPTKSWKYVGAAYSGRGPFSVATPSTTGPSTDDFANYMRLNAGLTKVRRMTANTSPAKVTSPDLPPTNADKYIWIKALIPAENNVTREAYDGEVFADVKVTMPDGTTKTFNGTSIQHADYYEYADKTIMNGAIKITGNNGDFIPTGTKIEVTKLWRSDPDPNDQGAIISDPQDILYPVTTVIDKTPPAPAKLVDDDDYVPPSTKSVSGYDGEPGATVSWQLIHNNQVTNGPTTTTVKPDGTWKLDGISGLKLDVGDQIRFIMTDAAGNSNPNTETVYHDATFAPATTLRVEGRLKMRVPLSIDFGNKVNVDRNNIPMQKYTGELSVTDTRHDLAWQITLSAQGGDLGTSDLPLYYGDDQGQSIPISNQPALIYTKAQPQVDENPFVISQDWTTSTRSTTDVPKGPYLKNDRDYRLGHHQGTLEWTLTNSLT
ncbi:pectate lyase-like adhesive domain-containing protein [Bombilactobacillus bombi]|uniref:pectate lyase-like adhesive domain-containing protein n=1 Tax=Bombilactobacillus bombi TaxID=1303590 RepID=UPI0011C41C67|nr:pectate lyase-like adhesive domain-containing protein [Bombilactobacillus bombi]